MLASAQVRSPYAVKVYVSAAINWDAILEMAPPSTRARLKDSIPSDPDINFVAFAIDLFEKQSDSALIGALADTGIIVRLMCDPDLSSWTEARRLAEACVRRDPAFDAKILNGAASDRERMPNRVARALELIDAISDCRRLVIPLLKFAKLGDEKVRSKTNKLMARASQNGAWIESILADKDPRVRSNVIEGLFTQMGGGAERLLRRAAKDPHHRVSTTALLCLAKLGDES